MVAASLPLPSSSLSAACLVTRQVIVLGFYGNSLSLGAPDLAPRLLSAMLFNRGLVFLSSAAVPLEPAQNFRFCGVNLLPLLALLPPPKLCLLFFPRLFEYYLETNVESKPQEAASVSSFSTKTRPRYEVEPLNLHPTYETTCKTFYFN